MTTRHSLQVTPASLVHERRIGSAADARRELGASHALEGSLIRTPTGVRVTYALVDAASARQIDALTVMALNPMRYLVVPTLVAGVIALPLLAWIFDVVGIYGGYLVAVKLFGMSSGTYFGQIRAFLDTGDIWVGFWKAIVFGLVITWVACYKGFHVGHGAEGVGRATTEAVVLASVCGGTAAPSAGRMIHTSSSGLTCSQTLISSPSNERGVTRCRDRPASASRSSKSSP